MPLTAIPRAPATTRYGVDVIAVNVTGYGGSPVAIPLVAYLQNCSLKIATDVLSGRSVLDLDDFSVKGVSGATLDVSKVAINTGLPLLALALADKPYFDAEIHTAIFGQLFKNAGAGSGKFLITSASLKVSAGVATESLNAVLQGPLVATPTAGTAPILRVDGPDTMFGSNTVSLGIGGSDFVAFFEDFGVDVSIDTAEGHAVMDSWKYATQTGRSVKINASRVVESKASTAAADNTYWMTLAAARGTVAVAITVGSKVLAGNAIVEGAEWTSGGNDAQKETINLRSVGRFTLV